MSDKIKQSDIEESKDVRPSTAGAERGRGRGGRGGRGRGGPYQGGEGKARPETAVPRTRKFEVD